jgi:hypothetical protein
MVSFSLQYQKWKQAAPTGESKINGLDCKGVELFFRTLVTVYSSMYNLPLTDDHSIEYVPFFIIFRIFCVNLKYD